MIKKLCIMALVPLVISIMGAVSAVGQQETHAVQQRMSQAKESLEKGKLTPAVALLDEVLKDDPKNLRAISLLGRAYISVGQTDEAKRFLRRALEIEPNDAEANLGMSVIFFLEAKFDGAKQYAAKALSATETRIDALNILGQIAAGENNLDDARRHFEELLSMDSTHYDALTNLGILYQQSGNELTALSFFQNVNRLYPQKPTAYHNLGVLYGTMGRLHDAIIALNTAATLDSLNPKHPRTLGILFLRHGLFQDAITSFQQALDRDFLDIESRIGKALSWWSLGEADKALKEVNDMTVIGVRFDRMELFLANIYFQKKEFETSIGLAREDVEQNPSKAEGHYLLGLLYQRRGDQEKAKAEFEEASRIAKQHPDAPLLFSINSFFPIKEK